MNRDIAEDVLNITMSIYNACLWQKNYNRPSIKGDTSTFDLKSIEAYRPYVQALLESVDIPQGKRAVGHPLVEMGLALGELTCETKPSTWYSDAPYGVPSLITRVYPRETIEEHVSEAIK
jgi:hypothetical protein